MGQFGMLHRGQSVLVAVSGGPDSTALLHVLYDLAQRLGIRLAAAHLNHGLRGAASNRDAAFAADQAQRLGVPFLSETRDVRRFQQDHPPLPGGSGPPRPVRFPLRHGPSARLR